jgi:CelD/BcsL family acetyltransferase involved in cellulose biosynthesis
MLEWHKKRFPKSYVASGFHENVIRKGLENEILHFSKMSVNGIGISWRICFYDSQKFYSYMPSINLDFSEFSPGKIHLMYCIKAAIEMQIPIYDQLRGMELYKSEWTKEFDTIFNYEYVSKSLMSQLKNKGLNLKKHLFS